MENLSILNLFNASINKIELPKQAPKEPQGEFENVFKKYLDRSAKSEEPKKADTALKDEKVSVKKEEPETPEEVINNLDIPEDQKEELKNMLAQVDSPESAEELLEAMVKAIQANVGSGENDVEIALTDMAKAILSSDEEISKEDNFLLEASLDKIIEVQKYSGQVAQKDQAPQLTALKGGQQNSEVAAQNGDAEGEKKKSENIFKLTDDKQEKLSPELEKKIIEAVEKKVETKAGNNDLRSDFQLKSESTEKVIKAEIKIESPKDIMKFAEMVELAKTQKANRLNIQLHPQELGKVSIELVEQSGRITGKVAFESEAARNLFASNGESLRQQLAEKGLVVENLEFLFQDFDQHQFAGWNSKDGKQDGKQSGGSLQDEMTEESEAETPQDSGNVYA